ncbi:tRNA-uridine aminocarboxypropyltransferase 2-like [Mercenaria mercenaria]|uniref:tRNA-uridine aminocarboxypropyltransferase 2-like n=1 Tax=Mercenaria mercenaria TaxID=6596 RepID=UPI00234F1F3A|nr:tRNA-uridine aminocarboxypropyltransferase 2-like [Mercenaria mercenaria]
MENTENAEDFLNELYYFANAEKEPMKDRRKECQRCGRPETVCWCPFLPDERIKISTDVFILQHPFEELRKLKTAPMLKQSLEEGKCTIIRGKRFSRRNIKYPDLSEVLHSPKTVLLFPGDDAVDIAELPAHDGPYNLVALDGTWTQARGMYINNLLLKVPKKVMINCDRKSKYVIRTQPTDNALSTLESVAVALSILENRPELADVLTAPLDALCDFQLQHGAVQHQSKEFKIANGLWQKALPKKVIRRMEKEKHLMKEQEKTNGIEEEAR